MKIRIRDNATNDAPRSFEHVILPSICIYGVDLDDEPLTQRVVEFDEYDSRTHLISHVRLCTDEHSQICFEE